MVLQKICLPLVYLAVFVAHHKAMAWNYGTLVCENGSSLTKKRMGYIEVCYENADSNCNWQRIARDTSFSRWGSYEETTVWKLWCDDDFGRVGICTATQTLPCRDGYEGVATIVEDDKGRRRRRLGGPEDEEEEEEEKIDFKGQPTMQVQYDDGTSWTLVNLHYDDE